MLLLLLVLVLPLIFFLLKHIKNGQFHHPPGPKGLPFIGNLHQFDPSARYLYFSNLAKVYGPILYLRLGRVPIVVVQSAQLAEEVLKTQDHNFCSRPLTVGMQKLSYNGLDISFSSNIDYHREMRKICAVHLFSSNMAQSFAPIRRDEVSRMINKIKSLSAYSKEINLSNLFMAFTTSHICRMAFGKRYEDEGLERSRFHSLLHDAQAMFVAFFFSDYFPLIGWVDKLTGLSAKLERVYKDLDVFYDEIISEHLNQDRPNSDEKDIIDVFLQLRKERSFAFELTLDHIKAVLMNIFVAGTATGAAISVWAMTELIKNPNVMRKVQDELRSMNQGKSFIEEDDLPKLEYFKTVVKETMRLHPPAPLLNAHKTLQKCSIQGYDILPKTLVYVNVWAIGRDPQSWKEPEIFMPERFLGSKKAIDFKGQNFEFIPFGAGRRMCPGINLGVPTIELALANLLLSFDWDLPAGVKKEDIDTDVLPGITMHKKNPLCLVARKSA